MIRFNEVDFGAGRPVDAYGPGFFRLGEEVVTGPLAVLPGGVADWAGLPALGDLGPRLDAVDILILGTGAEHLSVAGLAGGTLPAHVGVETMATPAACRTYNVLLAEGRRVALAAMPVA